MQYEPIQFGKTHPGGDCGRPMLQLKKTNPAPCDAGLVKANRDYFRRRNISSVPSAPMPASASVDGSGAAETV